MLLPGLALAIFEGALDAMMIADDDRRYVAANDAACTLLGLRREDLLQRSLDDLVAPEGRAALASTWAGFLKDGSMSGEFVLLTDDGTPIAVDFRATANVLPGRHLSVLRDISGKAAVAEARQSVAAYLFLARVLEHVADAVHVVDDQQRFVFVNRAAVDLLGYDAPEELVGLRVHETIHYKYPDGSPFPVERCPHVGLIGSGEVVRAEDCLVKRDGSMVAIGLAAASLALPGGAGVVVAYRDVGPARRAAQDAEQEREFLGAVLESLETGIVACDASGALSLSNSATREMHGVEQELAGAEDWAGRFDLYLPDGVTPMPPEGVPLKRALRGERVRGVEMVIAPPGGPARTVVCNGQAIVGKNDRPLGAVVAMHDITDRRSVEEQLAHRALHDALTGLPNRTLLNDRIERALAVARITDIGIVVVFADLDHFKVVNDTFGRAVGDEMLTMVAARLGDAIRASDAIGHPVASTVARVGDDEFVVLCEGTSDEVGAAKIAGVIVEAIRAPLRIGEEAFTVTASLGIAIGDKTATSESLLRDADAAASRAKERGRDRLELFDKQLNARAAARLRAEQELRRAVEHGELRLHYQPIVAIDDGAIVAVEALVRWEHPERGLLAPSEFIPLAEQSGLVAPLGAWVLKEACRQLATWTSRYGPERELRVSVNVSARQLARPEIVAEIQAALHAAGAAPPLLALEITETALLEDSHAPAAALQALQDLGCPVLLDDFGTGYSSLSYLADLPIETLKLDRSFVTPLNPSGYGNTIASAVVELAHALGMTVVAEGVETAAQRAVLQRLGCDFAQGYLFARPLSAAELTALLDASP
ncbi:MAG: EAL domain-containing protein [Solirubrobacteraceae bacterium]